jgi:RimJ/RimL family protein N-acetyltransferase
VPTKNEDAWAWLNKIGPFSDDFFAAVEDGRREYIHRSNVPLLIGEPLPRAGEFPRIAPIIKTERLTLRPYRREDFQLLCDVYATERSRYVGGPLPPRAVWNNFMNSIAQWPILGMGTWAIELNSSRECVGEVAVSQPPNYPEPELGWLLFNGHEGNGYAFEAAVGAKAYGTDVRKVASLVSYIDPDNTASQRLAERLGARHDPTAATPNGDPCLVYRYQLPTSNAD